jgi:hypothetical protein
MSSERECNHRHFCVCGTCGTILEGSHEVGSVPDSAQRSERLASERSDKEILSAEARLREAFEAGWSGATSKALANAIRRTGGEVAPEPLEKDAAFAAYQRTSLETRE